MQEVAGLAPKGICECLGLLVEYAREQFEYPVQRESEYLCMANKIPRTAWTPYQMVIVVMGGRNA